MPDTRSNNAAPGPVGVELSGERIEELAVSGMNFEEIEALYGEETAISVGIARDPDAPELTAEDFAQMRPAIEVDPELVMAYRRGELRIRPDLMAKRVNEATEAGDKQEERT